MACTGIDRVKCLSCGRLTHDMYELDFAWTKNSPIFMELGFRRSGSGIVRCPRCAETDLGLADSFGKKPLWAVSKPAIAGASGAPPGLENHYTDALGRGGGDAAGSRALEERLLALEARLLTVEAQLAAVTERGNRSPSERSWQDLPAAAGSSD